MVRTGTGNARTGAVRILAALFVEGFDIRTVDGGSARLDLTGVHFSTVPPGPFPVTITPHLVVLLHCPPDAEPFGVLETVFTRDGEQVARNAQPVQVDPGRFGYRLVRAELTFDGPGTVEARCRVGDGEPLVVPLTVLAAGSGT